MTAKDRIAMVLALAAANSLLCSGQVSARPPTETASQTSALTVVAPMPLIGRVRVRGEILDLTRVSVAAGGPAHDVAQGTARVIADAEVSRAREYNNDPLGKR